ncbi:MAG: response regulator [Ketobacteraceae bacterium]|nr:response regulator [Ketobacteraceae bacterium]
MADWCTLKAFVKGETRVNNHKILLVEDNADEEELALIAFRRSGVDSNDIFVARDGQEAVDYLFAEGDYASRSVESSPKVVFLDINLPKLNGFEVLKRIRADKRTSVVPIVVLTSSDEQRDLLETYRLGANSFVRKALDFDEFIDNVNELRKYWLDLNLTAYE